MRITQNRPEVRNAQNLQLTYDLNDAFDAAAQDDDIKVIILAGAGPHFSAGHDLRAGPENIDAFKTVGCPYRKFNPRDEVSCVCYWNARCSRS